MKKRGFCTVQMGERKKMRSTNRLLIIDDEEELRSIIAQRLKRKGFELFEAALVKEGLTILKENLLDAVLLDMKLPDGNGLDLLKQIKELQPDIQVIILTGHGSMESAIETMKAGAYDYVTKPCNPAELEIIIRKALEQRMLEVENKGLRQVMKRQASDIQIIGESQGMKELLEMTLKVAQTEAPVLIQGESGTGKELIARAVHLWSMRSSGAFVPLNVGAIPENLIESELFGHEKGAFTGASVAKTGLVEIANGGTLFLDEMGEMPLALQVKLLRFLETGEFRRVGDTRLRKIDVRIVAATNRNLAQEVYNENFRADLYYRLNALALDIPPLRERRADILPLAEFFLKNYTEADRKKVGRIESQKIELVLSDRAKEALLHYDFPGNVRELAHLIRRGEILANGESIEPEDLWPKHGQSLAPVGEDCSEDIKKLMNFLNREEPPTLEEIEKYHILTILEKVNWNRSQAAKILGISVRNLYRKILSYGMEER